METILLKPLFDQTYSADLAKKCKKALEETKGDINIYSMDGEVNLALLNQFLPLYFACFH